MTPDQEARKNEIFTAEKIIDVSKAISNEKRLLDSVASLEKKLKLAQSIIESQEEDLRNQLAEITYLTGQLEASNKFLEKLNPIIEKENKTSLKSRFQLSPYLFLQDFNYRQINFSLNLKYNVKQFYIQLGGGTISTPELSTSQRQLYSTIGIGYNILK